MTWINCEIPLSHVCSRNIIFDVYKYSKNQLDRLASHSHKYKLRRSNNIIFQWLDGCVFIQFYVILTRFELKKSVSSALKFFHIIVIIVSSYKFQMFDYFLTNMEKRLRHNWLGKSYFKRIYCSIFKMAYYYNRLKLRLRLFLMSSIIF